MTPYFAVIKDSFREALASRVLWVLFVVITLVLLGLAPFGYEEEATTHLGDADIENFGDFVQRIQAAGEIEDKIPAKRVWEQLTEKQRKDLNRFKPGENPDGIGMMRVAQRFIGQLNEMIDSEDFYDASYWGKTRLVSKEARDLAKRRDDGDTLTEVEVRRLNRLAMESAFPDIIKSGFPTSLQFLYGTYEVGPTLPISRNDFNNEATGWAAFVMKLFVGVVGVVIAILITASIIPQMFDPGSLHLLLSFPISRSLLFLSKYFGGCAFIFLAATYLIGGLWALLGIRFSIWEVSLLYCIPLYVFVFAIYYAVSALAGVIWRNSLISIALAVLFGGVCWSMGLLKSGYESFALDSATFSKLVKAEDDIFGVNQAGIVKRWNSKKRKWEEAFLSDSQRAMQMVFAFMPEVPAELRPIGPVYDAQNDRLVNVIRDMQAGGSLKTLVGTRDKGWEPQDAAPPPVGMMQLIASPNGDLLAVSPYALYRAEGDITKKPAKKKDGLLSMIPLNMSKGPFKNVGPDPAVTLQRPRAAAVDRVNGDLALYSRAKVSILAKGEDGKYEIKEQAEVDVQSDKEVVMAATGGHLLIGSADGNVHIYDDQLKLKKAFKPEPRSAAKLAVASPDGETFAVTFNNGNLWLLDATAQEATRAAVRGQGDISATLFSDGQKLLVTHQSVRVDEYDLGNGSRLGSYGPPMDIMERVYRYGIYPLYYIFPKPRELDRTIDYTLADEDDAKKIENPLQPVYSSAAFIIGVLVICCIFVERQEF